jgi:hypothetical protein
MLLDSRGPCSKPLGKFLVVLNFGCHAPLPTASFVLSSIILLSIILSSIIGQR